MSKYNYRYTKSKEFNYITDFLVQRTDTTEEASRSIGAKLYLTNHAVLTNSSSKLLYATLSTKPFPVISCRSHVTNLLCTKLQTEQTNLKRK